MKKLKIRNRSSKYTDYYKNQYAPQVLIEKLVNVDSWSHREKRTEIDPIAYCLVIRVAQLLTKNPPIFLDENDEEIEEIKDFWIINDYDTIFRNVIAGTRTHGFCGTEALKETYMGNKYFVYTLKDIVTVDYNEKQNIKSYTVLPQFEKGEKMQYVGVPEQREVEIDNLLHYSIGRKKNNQQGISVLRPVWAQMIRANEILESMAAYDSRIGHGIFGAFVPKEMFDDPTTMTALNNSLQDINNRRYITLPTSKDAGNVDLKFVGATSAMDFPRDLETMLGYISAATGFNIRFFIGDPKGAQSAAKEDKIAIFMTLKSIFAEYKDWIRKFIEMFMEDGETISAKIKQIEWNDDGVLERLITEGNKNPEKDKEIKEDEEVEDEDKE